MEPNPDKPGPAGTTPPKIRIKTPPRNLPAQLMDQARQFTNTPTSPGKRSPGGRPKTMKEYEEDLINLKKENFNLKVRIYFMEQNHFDPNVPTDFYELRNTYINLKVEHEETKKDLSSKEDLLLNTFKVLESQKAQVETMKDYEQEKKGLLEKIQSLEEELKEYHIKFLESSVQLDDTNAMYAFTFGLNNPKNESNDKEKIKELEDELQKEVERFKELEHVLDEEKDKVKGLEISLDLEKKKVLSLEETVTKMEADLKSSEGQKKFEIFHERLEAMENKLKQAIKEKSIFEKSAKDSQSALNRSAEEKTIFSKLLTQKEAELQNLKEMYQKSESDKQKYRDYAQKYKDGYEKTLKDLTTKTSKSEAKLELLLIEKTKENQGLVDTNHDLKNQVSKLSSSLKEIQNQALETQRKLSSLQNDNHLLPQNKSADTSAIVIQQLLMEVKSLQKQNEGYKKMKCLRCGNSLTQEVTQNIEETSLEVTNGRDILIAEQKCKIEELSKIIEVQESQMIELKTVLDQDRLTAPSSDNAKHMLQKLRNLEDLSCNMDKENEFLTKEMDEKNKEIEHLKMDLKKKTFNLQGLVNTELWSKNREIEKLNKVCERQHLEILSLQKQLTDCPLTLMQDRSTSFTSSMALQSGIFMEDKENVQPLENPLVQIQHLIEEKRLLVQKVDELQARLLNTPERDLESVITTLRAERDRADHLRQDAVNACMLLTTRLQELADFLDSLLPSLCGRRRRAVQQAVERSRELSRTLSLAAEESTIQDLHCTAWSDLQPSLYVPLLPDISTVDFWSGEDSPEDSFKQVERLKSQAEGEDIVKPEKEEEVKESNNCASIFLKSGFNDNKIIDDDKFFTSIADITASLVEASSDQVEDQTPVKSSTEVKSANIGKITLTSKKKEKTCSASKATNKTKENDGCLSDNEIWSEPDRDVSYARMGLKEDATSVKTLSFKCEDTSETAESSPKSSPSRKVNEVQRLQRKVRSLEQLNEALKNELVIFHKLAPAVSNRQDKATSIELSRQNTLNVPTHLLEEIKNQREKLEASLFHNDYIRRQLESTVSCLRKSQGDDTEKSALVKLKEVTNQLELAQCELSKMKILEDNWNKKVEMLQLAMQQNASELIEKQCSLMEAENKSCVKVKEIQENCRKKCFEIEQECNQKCAELEQKCLEWEKKWTDLQNEKVVLVGKVEESTDKIAKLKNELNTFEQEGKKNKNLQEELNLKLHQICQQKDNVQRVVSEQKQLLADAERERQELATQLIARDRQVSELESRQRLSGELEAALRSQLDLATSQCAHFEKKLCELDTTTQKADGVVAELQRRLDAARYAHSEAVLQYTRVANDNIRLQQELRRMPQRSLHTTTNLGVAAAERVRRELEQRVLELEVANTELETRLASLNVVRPPLSDCESESQLTHYSRQPHPSLRSHDLTSDYLSDQDAVLSSPQSMGPQGPWFPMAPHSPDLGIESDHGRFSSLDTQGTKSSAASASTSLRGTPIKDLTRLEEENTKLRRNLQKTRHSLEETLAQLTAANQHKRQYEAQLSAANQHKAKVERAICRQLHKTESILKKARVNLEDDGEN